MQHTRYFESESQARQNIPANAYGVRVFCVGLGRFCLTYRTK